MTSPSQPSSILVQLTPPGRGAVATLLIEGPRTEEVAGELLFTKSGRRVSDRPADRPFPARFGSENGEEVIVRHRAIDSIELHCHGGYAAIQAIEHAFVNRGFASISWKDWAADRTDDPFAAAARIALADARTERTAAILLDQYGGALRRAYDEIHRTTDFQSVQMHAQPFPTDCQLPIPNRQIENLSYVQTLLERAPLGLHLTQPWRVVLAGEPNVGKSSLLNALVGYDRAIVHRTPGTTRDAVTAQTAFEGWPVELCDTAGLRALENRGVSSPTSEIDDIERAGIELAKQQIIEADLLLLIFDAEKPWTVANQSLVDQHPQALIVYNKADLARLSDGRPTGYFVSALTGQGIEELGHHIAGRLVPNPPPPGAAVPFTEQQVEQLKSIMQSMKK